MRLRLAECLLVLASTGLTCLVAETAFSLVGLRYVPLRLQGELPDDVRVFAQLSKSGVLPRDPVLLLGDSYAQGYGDWLLEADVNSNGPFHSGHVIQAESGRDVITLGVSGAGSAEGVAAVPAAAYAQSDRARYLRLPKPAVAVVYFYEGNDLNNNLSFLKHRVADPEADGLTERIDRSLAEYPAAFFVPVGWERHFPLSRFVVAMVQQLYTEATGRAPAPIPDDPTITAQSDSPNAVEVAGKSVELPGHLQSPALELTHAELQRGTLVYERSLAFLQKLLPGTPVLVVYVPSPLSSYKLLGAGISSQQYVEGRATHFPTARVAEYSNAICELIRSATIGHGAGFLDLRPAIRAVSARDLVHGPRDYKHFNRKGMEALGLAVAGRLDQPRAAGTCAEIAN